MDHKGPLSFPVILNKSNYLLWARTTKVLLASRGLLSHIQFKGKQKDDERSEMKWIQDDMAILGAFHCALDAPILQSYSHCESAKELWDTVSTVYGDDTNFTKIYNVKKALHKLTQSGADLTTYHGKHSELWAELQMLRPSTTDIAVINERIEQDRIFGYLMGLDSSFKEVTRHILRGDTLPSYDKVCSQLQKEESNMELMDDSGSLPTANKSVVSDNKKKKRKKCEHCKKTNHTKDKCWILHPHLKPDKFKTSSANVANENSEEEEENQERAIVQVGRSNKERAMVASKGDKAASSSTSQETFVMNKVDLEALFQSFASKMHSGIALHTSPPSSSLVIDSGASHHMISNLNLLSNLEPALGSVSIANGTKVPIE